MLNINYTFFLLIFSLILSNIILFLCLFFSTYAIYYTDKLSVYECGFQHLHKQIEPFQINFFIVAILFIIFDLEILFLIPWCLSINSISYINFSIHFIGLFFILIVYIGFLYEFYKGVLDWK